MKLVVGLGNPGQSYTRTRHNIGLRCVSLIAQENRIQVRPRSRAHVGRWEIAGAPVLLARPRGFMNCSGDAVRALLRSYHISPGDLIVICDDLDLPLGILRIRAQGGSGGHKGLQSIIDCLGTQSFARLRVGIGRAEGVDPVEYVLSPFTLEEEAKLTPLLQEVHQAIRVMMTEGLEKATNRFNRKGVL